ncbi:molybdopterin converting factor subunit 1 [Bermanella sp. WJH001]|mgnify:FL=1|uniref:molybdopterin converting factor subunit 1 n=1 Tax=Bermanella sp. WJH001 TaxID=3048005 RepID=UPI0024BD9421|nr:molybdopterin converting factor subunit 1 [Bermanella sp. WJH001]MDJ1537977.1 molybdopterin converting factor subunit 1 [Bermanella sp. WJH001]
MIKVLFFAQLRELLKTNEIILDKIQACSIEELKKSIISTHPQWAVHLTNHAIMTSVNQTLVSSDHIVKENDEVAFFPPVTGG